MTSVTESLEGIFIQGTEQTIMIDGEVVDTVGGARGSFTEGLNATLVAAGSLLMTTPFTINATAGPNFTLVGGYNVVYGTGMLATIGYPIGGSYEWATGLGKTSTILTLSALESVMLRGGPAAVALDTSTTIDMFGNETPGAIDADAEVVDGYDNSVIFMTPEYIQALSPDGTLEGSLGIELVTGPSTITLNDVMSLASPDGSITMDSGICTMDAPTIKLTASTIVITGMLNISGTLSASELTLNTLDATDLVTAGQFIAI